MKKVENVSQAEENVVETTIFDGNERNSMMEKLLKDTVKVQLTVEKLRSPIKA